MKIPWATPWLDQSERQELMDTFDSTWLSMGPRTKIFEEKMRHYVAKKHAVAVSNGTVALDIALKALGIGPGDEVIVPAMTYIATVSSVLYQHATPIFADIEKDTYNIDPASVEQCVTPRTKCILYIDYGGSPADYEGLQSIADKNGIPLLHDAAQSFGGTLNGDSLCRHGRISTVSFHTAKLMTTIEGGMVFTDDDHIARLVKMTRNQGEDLEQKYIHQVLGTNARMTDMQAAIGLKQFEKLDAIIQRRREIAEYYYSCFADSDNIELPRTRKGGQSAYFFAPILVNDRDQFSDELNKVGIATRKAYPLPVYDQPFFDKYRQKDQRYDCPNAVYMTSKVINLPMFHAMTESQLQYIVENVLQIADQKCFSK
jgi:perosamine synthetase